MSSRHQPSPADVYGWRDLNTNEGRTVTGSTPKDSVENTAWTMMTVFGWSNSELRKDMEKEIMDHIHALNTIYWSKVDRLEEARQRAQRKREIAEMLKWSDLKTATYTSSAASARTSSTGDNPGGPNECFTSDGTGFSIARVAVRNTRTGEIFEFDSTPFGCSPWLPAQEGNDGWRIGSAGQEKTSSVNTREWRIPPQSPNSSRSLTEKEQRQNAYNEFMHPEDPSRGTPLSVYDDIDDDY